MNKVKATLFGGSVVLSTVAGIGMFNLGWMWIYEGFGLHPFISIPAGLAAIALPFAFMNAWIDDQY